MNLQRILAALAALCTLALPASAMTQSYPTKAIRFILPFSAGGAADVLARPIAQRLSETLKQPVVADNRSGAGGNVAMELTASAPPDGYTMVHVPYGGGGPAMTAVLANQIEIVSTPLTTVVPMVRAGRLRGIAVTTAKRSPVLPDVPTIAESGFPGFDASVWYCIVAPAGVPKRIVDALHTALVAVLHAPDLRDRLTESGVNIETSTPAELAAFVKAEIPKWAKVVKLSGAKPD